VLYNSCSVKRITQHVVVVLQNFTATEAWLVVYYLGSVNVLTQHVVTVLQGLPPMQPSPPAGFRKMPIARHALSSLGGPSRSASEGDTIPPLFQTNQGAFQCGFTPWSKELGRGGPSPHLPSRLSPTRMQLPPARLLNGRGSEGARGAGINPFKVRSAWVVFSSAEGTRIHPRRVHCLRLTSRTPLPRPRINSFKTFACLFHVNATPVGGSRCTSQFSPVLMGIRSRSSTVAHDVSLPSFQVVRHGGPVSVSLSAVCTSTWL
jgi:hypothetical protein